LKVEVEPVPYANSEGVRIHYEVDGAEVPLVLLHGLSWSLEWWHELGYAQALKGLYQLILIDARGHGRSDKPHTPDAYGLALDVADTIAVLDDLRVEKAHFLGYSMGGRIGFGLAKSAPERFRSFVIGGSGADEVDPGQPDLWADEMIKFLKNGIDAWVAPWGQLFGPWMTSDLKARGLANDAEALIARRSRREWIGLADALPTMATPSLLFVGEDDGALASARKAAQVMSNATLVSLPGLDHFRAVCRVDLVMPHILRFLAEVG